MANLDPIVSVVCITFNHSKYIKRCLEGFVMQKCTYPIEVIIHDDASTDGTQDIIKKEIENNLNIRWIPILQSQNKYCEGNGILATYVYPKCNGKYIALCEGDDYWTDPFKLQKQVDFLESHPDYSMCFHTAIQHWEDGRKPDEIFHQVDDREYIGEELFEQWTAATASVLLRKGVIESDIYKKARQNKKFIYGDIITWLSAAHKGKIWGMSDAMSVYRRQETGAVFNYDLNRIKRQAYHSLEIYKIFGKQYKVFSKQKFFQYAQDAFFGQKANGKIDYPLLWDLVKYTPVQTLNKIVSMFTDKIRK